MRPHLWPTLVLVPLALLAGRVPAARAAEGVPPFEHVIVVVMENHAYDTVRNLPYTATLVTSASSFTNSFGLTHPSQPNYLALWGGSTMGVTVSDCPPPGAPYSTANLGQACEAAALAWKGYCEALPAPGDPVCETDDALYVRRHAPWYAWNNLSLENSVPFTQFATDTAAHALPRLAFVIPDQCHNSHDCAPQDGDAWLSEQVPGLLRAVGPRGLVVLTWDEDDYSDDNHILTVFAGPLVRPGYASARFITHYSVLRTLCAGLGLAPFAGALADSAVTDVWAAGVVTSPPMHVDDELRLDAPAPVPTRGEVRATLHLGGPARVDAAVYDAAGRRVRELVRGERAGEVTLRWDGRDERGTDAGAGVFFVRVRAAGREVTRSVVRVR